MTWQIWFAVAAIVLTIVGLVKRLETRMLLVVAGGGVALIGLTLVPLLSGLLG